MHWFLISRDPLLLKLANESCPNPEHLPSPTCRLPPRQSKASEPMRRGCAHGKTKQSCKMICFSRGNMWVFASLPALVHGWPRGRVWLGRCDACVCVCLCAFCLFCLCLPSLVWLCVSSVCVCVSHDPSTSKKVALHCTMHLAGPLVSTNQEWWYLDSEVGSGQTLWVLYAKNARCICCNMFRYALTTKEIRKQTKQY